MRVVSSQMVRRWAAVAAGTAVLCALPAAVGAIPVAASALTAAQLRDRIAASARVPFEGYAESYVDLGLPSLPDLGNVVSLLDGTTDQYVWYASPDRVARGPADHGRARTTCTRPRRAATSVDYTRNDLLTQVVGSAAGAAAAGIRPAAAGARPASCGLRAAGRPGSRGCRTAGCGRCRRGRAAAGPAAAGSTISAVDIWADPGNGLPVEAEVFGRGSAAPVLVTRFLSVGPEPPGCRHACAPARAWHRRKHQLHCRTPMAS